MTYVVAWLVEGQTTASKTVHDSSLCVLGAGRCTSTSGLNKQSFTGICPRYHNVLLIKAADLLPLSLPLPGVPCRLSCLTDVNDNNAIWGNSCSHVSVKHQYTHRSSFFSISLCCLDPSLYTPHVSLCQPLISAGIPICLDCHETIVE